MNFLKNNWLKLLAIIVLLVATGGCPEIYYQFLRWVILAIASSLAYSTHKAGRVSQSWFFVTIAVLFNPFIVFPFTVIIWQSLDIIAAMIFLASILKMNEGKGGNLKNSEKYKKLLANSWYKPLKLVFNVTYFSVILFVIFASLKGHNQAHYLWGLRGEGIVTDGSWNYVFAQIFWGIMLAIIAFGLLRGVFVFVFTKKFLFKP